MRLKNLHYLVCIKIEKTSGKELASYYKSKSLSSAIDGLRIISVIKKRGQLYNLLNYFLLEVKYLISIVTSSEKPKIIISRCFFNFAPLIIKKIYGTRIYTEIHSDSVGEVDFIISHPLKKSILKTILKFGALMIRRYDGIIFNHPTLERELKTRYKYSSIRSISVYNGAPNSDTGTTISREEILNYYKLPKDKIFLVFAGGISKWHGLENLIDLFPYLSSLNPQINLIIIGDSKNKDYYEKIKKRKDESGIIFMGKMKNEEVEKIYNIGIAGVIPVNNIRMSPGSPIKLYDMISSNLPIITQKNTLGYSDVVNDHSLGIVIDFKNHKESALTISKFIDDLQNKRLIYNNSMIAKSKLSWDNVIKKWISFIAYDIK